MIGNLLTNVRVSHAGRMTPVEVRLRAIPDDGAGPSSCRVVDHGPGIDPAHVAHVFDRFYRADPGRSRDRGGSGLGLSIVASIVAAHGGRLWHERTTGGGATFVVTLEPAEITASSQVLPGSLAAEAD